LAALANEVINSNFVCERTLNDRVLHFLNTHIGIFDKWAPIKKLNFYPKTRPTRLTNATKNLQRKRDICRKLYLKDKDYKLLYKKYDKLSKKAVLVDTRLPLSQDIDSYGSWKVINQLRATKNEVDTNITATEFNDYFSRVKNDNVSNLPSNCNVIRETPVFQLKTLNAYQLFYVRKTICKRNNETVDHLGFSMKMLSLTISAPNVYNALLDLINDSISTNVYPDCF